jgi:Uma2 family endonuclease
MEAQPQQSAITVDDYLSGEQRGGVRHEYIGGVVYDMAGASDAHIAICMNLAFALRRHLQGSRCRVQMSEGKVRLRLAEEDIFYYPDVMVLCDPRDTDRYFKRYPKTLIEVLSDSTEAIDRREKSLNYRQIETLEEYVLAAQDQIEVTLFRRSTHWQPEILRQPEQDLRLPSLDLAIPLGDIYEGVEV